MIWLSRILTVLEIIFIIKTIRNRRKQACQQQESSKMDGSMNATTNDQTDLLLSTSYELTPRSNLLVHIQTQKVRHPNRN